MAKRLAVITSHPIQYQAPWFRALSVREDLEVEVFFCHQATPQEQSAAGFGVSFAWDMPLLEGYSYRFLKNVAAHPTIGTFAGLDTPEIKDIIRREGYDAVIVNGWHFKSAWQAFRACWHSGTPVMARGDSTLYNQRDVWKKILKWPYYRWFIPKLDACLAVGKWSREYYLHYGARADRIFLVPHVIDDRFFSCEAVRLNAERGAIRADWGLDEGATVFLFAGKFIDIKRPMDFVRALERASADGRPVMGLMVGDGPLRSACEEYARKQHVPVKFTGFLNQSQIVRAYVACDALVLASGSETWGLVVNEAMACGRPCIVTDKVGCGPDLVRDGSTGFIYPMGDVIALADLLVTLAADATALKRISNEARELIRTHTVQAAVDGVLQAMTCVSNR